MGNSTYYKQKALEFAERYGIIDYVVENNKMIYQERFIITGTYTCTVNLDTMEEIRNLM